MALTLTESPVFKTVEIADEVAIIGKEQIAEAQQLVHLSKMYEEATIFAGPAKAEKMITFIYENATAHRPEWAKPGDETLLAELGRRLTGLQIAKARLLKHGWTKGRAYTGPEHGASRTGMCLGAALDLGPTYVPAGRYVSERIKGENLGGGGIPHWNDTRTRQFHEVIALLDDCIHVTLAELAEAV
jgi:hypothetical protein